MDRGCCAALTALLLAAGVGGNGSIGENERVDCYPQGPISEEECRLRGCTFQQASQPGPPPCYMTHDMHRYVYAGPQKEDSVNGWSVVTDNEIKIRVETTSNFSISGDAAVRALSIEFEAYSTRVMGFRIKDADNERYEVPASVLNLAIPRRLNKNFYRVEYVSDPNQAFAFKIIRASTNVTLFDTTIGGMIFEDRFLQVVTRLASKYLYGFGENRHQSFRHQLDWSTTPIFSRHTDPHVRDKGSNYGGVHPFYMVVEDEGPAHGVFLLNSNAIEYKVQPSPALTLRAMGGVMEFVVCMGATPNDLILEYTQVVGRPELPPYTALGFHQEVKVEDAADVIKKMRQAQLPLDVLHIRSRASDQEWDVTVMKDSLSKAVAQLQANGSLALVTLPPYIRVDAEDEAVRQAYQEGLWKDVFVKWPKEYAEYNDSDMNRASFGPDRTLLAIDEALLSVALVDFFQPKAVEWWQKWLTSLQHDIPWDGYALQHNQPFSPHTNQEPTSPLRCSSQAHEESSQYKAAAIPVWNSSATSGLLSDQTICMDGQHVVDNKSVSHYNLHNLYGHAQAAAANKIIQKLKGKRGLVMTEAHFAGTGAAAGAWLSTSLKDSPATAIKQSIISAFEYNMFGMTMTGGNALYVPTEEASCLQWQVFTMFHVLAKSILNSGPDMEDGCLQYRSVREASRKALNMRYTLLPYLYTLFYHGWMEGEPLIRPLFYEYSTKHHHKDILEVDRQFLWGPALMFVPNIEGGDQRSLYMPDDTWYNVYQGQDQLQLDASFNSSRRKVMVAPKDEMVIFQRGGYIIPVHVPFDHDGQSAPMSIAAVRKRDFGLWIAPYYHDDGSAAANGNLYWDDGQSLDTIEKEDYMSWFIYNSWQEGNCSRALLDYDVERNNVTGMDQLKFRNIVISGYKMSDRQVGDEETQMVVRKNGQRLAKEQLKFFFDRGLTVQFVEGIPLSQSFKLDIIHPLPTAKADTCL
ncbi:hypothetical protein RvY_18278 [Ramazzottius varieornatus]|uniref:P-type domain-containing protein n=1 Tax=Ramazzottius varieornatus TaxID=947166 RepID=A0A1D1W6V6_RAMVA|nr:hypothetical protein RvY_18278 [Ramazzottius varieornatus]